MQLPDLLVGRRGRQSSMYFRWKCETNVRHWNRALRKNSHCRNQMPTHTFGLRREEGGARKGQALAHVDDDNLSSSPLPFQGVRQRLWLCQLTIPSRPESIFAFEQRELCLSAFLYSDYYYI
jgi:hypothetical protein